MTNPSQDPALLATTQEFLESLNRFAWKADYLKFCETLGFNTDQYSEQKYKEIRELISYLGCFDVATITKMIEAGND